MKMAEKTFFSCLKENDIKSLKDLCILLHENKRKFEEKDYYGNTPLLVACYLGRFEAVDVLLKFGADCRTINYFGQNALTLATYSGNLDIIKTLLLYCSYKEFNKRTLTPAICIAAMSPKSHIYQFFKNLDQDNYKNIKTAHGINVDKIMAYNKQYEEQK